MQKDKNQQRNITAVQQLAETFGNLDEMLEVFDDILARMMWAYTGREQPKHYLTGDYDFINQLKQAVKTDLKNTQPTPNYTSENQLQATPLAYQKISNVEQIVNIAKAKGISDFKVVTIGNEQVLLTNWTKAEATAYQSSGNQIEGYFSDEGAFILRFLHLLK